MKCSKCKNEAVEGIKVCQTCREKLKKHHKKYYDTNRGSLLAQKKKYSATNKEKIHARNKVWRHSGVCVDCGGIPVNGLVRCQSCRDVANIRNKERREKIPKIITTTLTKEELKAIKHAYLKEYHAKHADKHADYYRNYRIINKDKISQSRRNKHLADPNISRSQNLNYNSRKRAGTFEKIDRKRVFERDSYVCQICSKQVDPSVHFRHPLYPTIDHVIPLAKGGAHTYFNVQCAHYGCNASKSDRLTVTQQYIKHIRGEQ